MSTRHRRYLPLALAALAIGPFAAAASSEGAAAPSAEPLVRAAQKPNGAGVDVRYRVQGTPAVGQPTEVKIVVGRVRDPAGASLRLAADPGLRLDASGATAALAAGDGPVTLNVTVVPQEEGLAYLNVFITQRGATSSTSIPIQTGAAGTGSTKSGASGRVKSTPEGDKILSMPVK